MVTKARRLHETYADSSYNWRKGWSTTAHPFQSIGTSDYLKIAKSAAPNLSTKFRAFMSNNNFTYIEITHEDFLDFESSADNFREWFEKYCSERKLDPHVDFLLMGPRVKTEDSANRKAATGNRRPDRIIDYLGFQAIALKQTTSRNNKGSLGTMSAAMRAIESSPETRAIKNHYWEPHPETLFRAHKSLWVVEAKGDPDVEGLEILAEIKIEHESQMDIDKLTRKFISINRAAERAQANASKLGKDDKGAAKHAVGEKEKTAAINALSTLLYNRVFEDLGINQLLNPSKRGQFPALPPRAILQAVKTTVKEHFTRGQYTTLVKNISSMSMFTQQKTTKDRRVGKG